MCTASNNRDCTSGDLGWLRHVLLPFWCYRCAMDVQHSLQCNHCNDTFQLHCLFDCCVSCMHRDCCNRCDVTLWRGMGENLTNLICLMLHSSTGPLCLKELQTFVCTQWPTTISCMGKGPRIWVLRPMCWIAIQPDSVWLQ